MIDAKKLDDDQLLETMTSLQGEMDRRYRVETLEKDIARLTGELDAMQAELARLGAVLEPIPNTPAGEEAAEPLDLSAATDWDAAASYEIGVLVTYKGKVYQLLNSTPYSPGAHPQAWKEVG